MKLSFSMPNMVRLKAMGQPWERDITGADMQKLAKWGEKLGFSMISVPEHHIIPPLPSATAYYDYTQWVAEEIMPAIA
jgi:alkanesulfonate monooxygenase SsuD/methylene tetrahydromethanopterin reductase-like flavin-dependent oxidoreductase (luciferase family)